MVREETDHFEIKQNNLSALIKEELGSSQFNPLFLVCFGVVLACLQLQVSPSGPATPSDKLLLESRSNLDRELTI